MTSYEVITQQIVKKMEEGNIPWVKPWHTDSWSCDGMSPMFPAYSYSTGKRYSLMNQFLLNFQPGEYATFDQVKKAGGHIKKGERSQLAAGWIVEDRQKKTADGDPAIGDDGKPVMERIFSLRYYRVFNVLTQCENIEAKHVWSKDAIPVTNTNPEKAAEDIIRQYINSANSPKFQIVEGSNEAYYNPSQDKVAVPHISQFESAAEYYSTVFHELTHSTGIESRCDRKLVSKNAAFGTKDYSREELVAEMGSCFLNGTAGLTTESSLRNSAAYIQNWLKVLKDDPKLIVYASSQAEKAVEYILNS